MRVGPDTGHGRRSPDHLPELVRLYGEVGALDRLEEAQRVCRSLAKQHADKGQHATAAGFTAAEENLRAKARDLVELSCAASVGLFA